MDEAMNEQDIALVHAVANNRARAAFDELFQHHHRAAFNLALHITGDRAAAEDALQEAMLNVWQGARHFRREGSVRSWILCIVARQSMRIVRQRRAKRDRIVRRQQALPAQEAVIADAAEDREQLGLLRGMLAELPHMQRQLLALYFGAELSQQEIGDYLNIPQSTVSRKIQHILEGLRVRLQRAGLAAAPLLAEEQLRALILSGEAPPPGLLEGLSTQVTQATKSLSIKTAASSSGSGWAMCLLLALTAAAVAGWALSGGKPKAAAPQQSDTAPAAATTSGEGALVLPARWVFDQDGLPEAFTHLEGPIQFGSFPASGLEMMQFPGPDLSSVMLNVPLPGSSVAIDLELRGIKDKPFQISLGISNGDAYIQGQMINFTSDKSFTHGTVVVDRWYLLGNRMLVEANDKPFAAALLSQTVDRPYLVISATHCAFREIRIRAIDEASLPQRVREGLKKLDHLDSSVPLPLGPKLPRKDAPPANRAG